MAKIVVLGGSGYVSGEAIRLMSQHPSFELAAVSSAGNIGVKIADVFPHLASIGDMKFCSPDDLEGMLSSGEIEGVLAALPHGDGKATLLAYADAFPDLKIVDLSADLRFDTPFYCGLPELSKGDPGRLVANPGCFATCTTLAAAPLAALTSFDLVAFGITGSTGSGRSPKATTHHPERHSGFWAYEPLKHRHRKEIEMMVPIGERRILFMPHSAPLSRGMHVTVASLLPGEIPVTEVVNRFRAFYEGCPMVIVRETGFPNVKDVVGSNYCHIGIAVHENEVAVMAVIDNLVKGAAGGGVQWLNRMFGLTDEAGLTTPALGWN